MMTSNAAHFLSFLPDIILILISGTACLYCFLLNRRLTKLQNLDTGLGATIVTLTKAIEDTYGAAKASQTSTLTAIDKLNDLLARSEKVIPETEGLVKALENSCVRANDSQERLEHSIQISLQKAVGKAEKTAADLLKIVAEIKQEKPPATKPSPAKAPRPADTQARVPSYMKPAEHTVTS